ncbi:23S rRNA (uracil-5-)-methyltransferase RumA [Thermococcus chitonophagus]|uniref:23S rRNA (Uracil-5-)-methyltransferase RumA n=1 Tax=Thermococcus chitonophagus TaxID=54262 RepID=A0A160VTM4_9EURY|nr:23S rRNA (uracil(1939)-C(5))-methyltransferase RlmD [Thermococcus chitonophagus]ASJ16819.1 23S rRNA (uracil-5-)-methyltransferase RumA [Thermococcus chitonophagus]CUX78290.1 RNA methyltransferase, TrmA family [Thermococcus chitonophagus]
MRGEVRDVSEDGLGMLEGILLPFAYPGDVVEVVKTRRRFGKEIGEFTLLKSSSLRGRPKCMHFGRCGGCLWQGLKYREQLRLKAELFERITGINAEIKPSPRIYGFRNITNLIVTVNGVGMKEFARPKTVVPLRECPVFSKDFPIYVEAIKEFLRESKLRPWNWKEGEVHYVQIREMKFTGEVMVNVVAHLEPTERVKKILVEAFDFVDSIYWSVKRDKRDDPRGVPIRIHGEEFIKELIEGIYYFIHPSSFFQTNSYALSHLLKVVRDYVEGEKVLDLYSGIGTFSLYLASEGFKVRGVEINEFSVSAARKSAEFNSLEVEFKVQNAENENLSGYDTIIVDPPRKGLGYFAEKIVREGPEILIYVSCNPKKFVLDYQNYLARAYKIREVMLVDMFPHTPHVEAVIKLLKS